MKLIAIVSLFLNLATSVEIPDRVKMESKLENVTKDLISMEKNVTKKLTIFGYQAKYCSSNLKASNFSKNFTDVVDNLMTFISEIQTMNDYQIQQQDLPLENLSSYDYIQYMILKQNSDKRHLNSIIKVIEANETKLNEFKGNVTSYYLSNYNIFMKLLSKNKTVMGTIRHFVIAFRELGIYIKFLTAHIGNMMKMNSYLSDLIINKTVIPPVDSTSSYFMEHIRYTEAKLVPLEQQIRELIKIDLDKIEIAEKTVTSSRVKRAPKSTKDTLRQLKDTLGVISTLTDYSLLGWPHLPDLPETGDRISIVLRSAVCDMKENDFMDIQDNARRNQSLVRFDREDLDASDPSVSSTFNERKVGAHSQPIQDVIDATLNVEGAYTTYIEKLDWAIIKMRVLKKNVPATMICGNFLPYNPSIYLDDPNIDGHLVGTYIDGSRVYVGRGNNIANGEKSCPGRISVDPIKPGVFMEATNKENFDGLTSEYLYNHRKLIWMKLNQTNTLSSNAYVVKFVSGSKIMMIARKSFSNYTQVGKISFGKFFTAYKPDTKLSFVAGASDVIEVLGCKKTFKPCGTFTAYDPTVEGGSDVLAMKGYAAGLYHDGSVNYMGMVYASICTNMPWSPGRLTTDPAKSGGYFVCKEDSFVNTNLRYLENHPDLNWRVVNANIVGTGTDVIKFISGSYSLAFGKVVGKFTNVGRILINTASNNGFYGWDPTKNATFKYVNSESFQILAC